MKTRTHCTGRSLTIFVAIFVLVSVGDCLSKEWYITIDNFVSYDFDSDEGDSQAESQLPGVVAVFIKDKTWFDKFNVNKMCHRAARNMIPATKPANLCMLAPLLLIREIFVNHNEDLSSFEIRDRTSHPTMPDVITLRNPTALTEWQYYVFVKRRVDVFDKKNYILYLEEITKEQYRHDMQNVLGLPVHSPNQLEPKVMVQIKKKKTALQKATKKAKKLFSSSKDAKTKIKAPFPVAKKVALGHIDLSLKELHRKVNEGDAQIVHFGISINEQNVVFINSNNDPQSEQVHPPFPKHIEQQSAAFQDYNDKTVESRRSSIRSKALFTQGFRSGYRAAIDSLHH